jgi:type IV pilus assembly protein PilW
MSRRHIPGASENRNLRSAGFSLVELMVAMVIGLIITFAVVQIFTTGRTTYQTDEGLARVQENGRFAAEFLSNDIRQAGDIGCMPARLLRSETKVSATTYDAFSADSTTFTGVQGYEFQGTGPGDAFALASAEPTDVLNGWLPVRNSAVPSPTGSPDATLTLALAGGANGLFPGGVPGSDAVVIQRMSNAIPPYNPHADQQYVYVPTALNAGGQLTVGPTVIANCKSATFFVATAIEANAMVSPDGSGTQLDRIKHEAPNTCIVWDDRGGETKMSGGGGSLPVTPACADELAPMVYTTDSTNISAAPVVGNLITDAYYIARGASGAPALFRSTANWSPAINGYGQPTAMELVDGVESMQILYGVDADGDGTAENYVTADNVTEWSWVVSVNISLLMRSSNVTGDATDLTDDTNTYVLGGPDAATGVTIDPFDDKRRRRVFNVSIRIRNH